MSALTEKNWEKRLEAVKMFMVTGSLRRTSELLSIPYEALCDWKKEDWWLDLASQVKTEANAKTDRTIKNIIQLSLDTVQERLEHGDWVFDQKTGMPVRKPVGVRDAADIAGRLLQQQLKVEELNKTQTEALPVHELLKTLANEFKKYNKIEVVDVEDAKEIRKPTNLEIWLEKKKQNALHDQRQEGLQEGSGSLYESSGSGEEASGTEQSPSYDGESR